MGGGGVLGVTGPPFPHSTVICRSIWISFRLGGSRSIKVAIFWKGGGGREGGRGVSEEIKTLGKLRLL